MNAILGLATGLDERSRKIVAYYTMATHTLPHVERFPLLTLKGVPGSGKSHTEVIIGPYAYSPRAFSLRGRTLAAIRDELAACYEGTAIVEEADQAWKDDDAIERLLSDRYQRSSAQAALKEQVSAKSLSFKTMEKQFFGATVLHRRLPFADSALDSRSIPVRFQYNGDRTYDMPEDLLPEMEEEQALIRDLEFKPVDVPQPPGVAPRTFDTYKPLLSVARICGDEAFEEQIQDLLLVATAELKAGQSVEPDGLVVRALVDQMSAVNGALDFHNIRFGDLADSVWANQRIQLQPKRIGALARQLGFETKESHGVTVVVPTVATLLRACSEVGYEDEAIAKLRKQVNEP